MDETNKKTKREKKKPIEKYGKKNVKTTEGFNVII